MRKKYQIIYADPPWKYIQGKSMGTNFAGAADAQYDCMPIEDIRALPVYQIAEDKCILFLWATFPMLREALSVIDAWGFEYKTNAFTWVKTNANNMGFLFGIGYYTKSNAEICLLATRGNAHSLVKDNSISQMIMTPKMAHSRKPSEVRERIVQLCGDIPRIELFARRKVKGWDCWGNEVESDIEL
jgi:site-specific DNA-methyltransferase (adenine-specific)